MLRAAESEYSLSCPSLHSHIDDITGALLDCAASTSEMSRYVSPQPHGGSSPLRDRLLEGSPRGTVPTGRPHRGAGLMSGSRFNRSVDDTNDGQSSIHAQSYLSPAHSPGSNTDIVMLMEEADGSDIATPATSLARQTSQTLSNCSAPASPKWRIGSI